MACIINKHIEMEEYLAIETTGMMKKHASI